MQECQFDVNEISESSGGPWTYLSTQIILIRQGRIQDLDLEVK